MYVTQTHPKYLKNDFDHTTDTGRGDVLRFAEKVCKASALEIKNGLSEAIYKYFA